MSRVLVIDGDRRLCQLLDGYFAREGMRAHFAYDGKSGLRSALSGAHDFVVLDTMLPELAGPQVIKQLRARSRVGLLIVSAQREELERIVALEGGADDYLVKPFNPRELVARIRAISRRLTPPASGFMPAPEYVTLGDLVLDQGTRTCRRNGELVHLTSGEFDLLSVFLRFCGQVIHRTDLSKQVLDREYSPYDRSIDVRVSSLRRKLGPLPDGTERIRSVRTVGYLYAHPATLHVSAS